MRFRALFTLVAITLFSAVPIWAGEWHGHSSAQPQVASTPKPVGFNITLKMLETPGNIAGPCVGQYGLADFCPSGNCTCYSYTGSATGASGPGTVTFYETYDSGDSIDTADGGCTPAYGEIDISGKKNGYALYFTGADCGSGFAPPFMTGGCNLFDSSSNLIDILATCSGSYSESKPTLFKIKGKGLQ